MFNRKLKARRRASKTRVRIKMSGKVRLCVHRSLKHLYAQCIIPHELGDKVLTSASTLDAEVKAAGAVSNNIHSAGIVGTIIAQRALACNIHQVVLDRSGNQYHGRVKALASAARGAGLKI